MADKRQSLAGLNMQIEAVQNHLIICVTEMDVVEVNISFQRRYISFVRLNDMQVSIEQCEDAFVSCKPRLDLRPERREVEHREEELVEAHDKEIPRAHRDNTFRRAQSANIDQNSSKDSPQRI